MKVKDIVLGGLLIITIGLVSKLGLQAADKEAALRQSKHLEWRLEHCDL